MMDGRGFNLSRVSLPNLQSCVHTFSSYFLFCLSLSLYVSLPLRLSVFLSLYLSASLFLFLSISPSLRLSLPSPFLCLTLTQPVFIFYYFFSQLMFMLNSFLFVMSCIFLNRLFTFYYNVLATLCVIVFTQKAN
jgi:hypothetical protein